MNKKVKKVVWICWFSNEDVMNRFKKTEKDREMSPWINELINIFETKNDIALHIITPNIFNNKNYKYKKKNIQYHLYKTTKFLPKRIFRKLQINNLTNYYFIKKRIKKIVNKINPDLIHFHGAENPIYSSSFLSLIHDYPILLTIQGFISQDEVTINYNVMKRKKIEMKIIRKCSNFGVRTNDMSNYIQGINSKATFFWHNYPLTKPKYMIPNKEQYKKYDCVFFGRVAPENGIKDLLFAISKVKKVKHDISLIVVGLLKKNYRKELLELCKSLDLSNNVEFTGFVPKQQEAFKKVMKAKMDILPTYYDIIPGTILQCMNMKVPVISYAVGGIPELNRSRDSIILVDKGDVDTLAQKILLLLEKDEFRNKLIENAKITVDARYENDNIYSNLIDIYSKIYNSWLKT